ncbi:MAG: hypothetical protein IPG67_14755 [Acidobacteria bacterium]|nr:hypothetical protein [Acidobacteriota bacterium]
MLFLIKTPRPLGHISDRSRCSPNSLREPANNELKRDLVNAYEYTARQLVKVGRDPDAIEKYRLAFDLYDRSSMPTRK